MLGIWLALLAALAFEHLEASHAQGELDSYKSGQAVYHQHRIDQLKEARDERDRARKDLRDYRAGEPLGVIKLCRTSSAVQARGPAGATASTPTAGIQPVHAGDSRSGAGEAGPDLGGLLDSFAASCDSVSADLREQQAVR